MKRRLCEAFVAVLLLLTLCAFTGCPKPEYGVRDGIASAKGFIEDQQTQHLNECKAAPTKQICVAINKAVAAQNLAIDALEVYCGSPDFNDNGGECKPDKSLEPKLTEAMRNLQDAIVQVKALAPKG